MSGYLYAGNSSVTLAPAPIPQLWVLSGNPIARAAVLSRSPDGLSSTMLWECTPGVFDWFYSPLDETLTVLSGRFILDEKQAVGPGDTVYFPAGSHARWRILEPEPVRKIAFLRRPMPRSVQSAQNVARRVKHAMLRQHTSQACITGG